MFVNGRVVEIDYSIPPLWVDKRLTTDCYCPGCGKSGAAVKKPLGEVLGIHCATQFCEKCGTIALMRYKPEKSLVEYRKLKYR